MRRWCGAWLAMILGAGCALAQSGPAQSSSIRTSGFKLVETLAVNATDAPRKIIHARLTIPATSGDFVLLYPKWIPGEHGPSGPLLNTAGIYFRAGGRALAWHRDPVDLFAFHIQVPEGVSSIEAELDYLVPVQMPGGYTSGSSATDKLAVLSWNWLVLYPKGLDSDEIGVKASLIVPDGWQWASALPMSSDSAGDVEFAPASLTTMVDSPVLMGEYMKKIPLRRGETPTHELDIASDSEAALAIQPRQVQDFDNLVAEAGALFGARHYRDYHFLLTLSNHVGHFGLEHHECNDSRVGENYLTNPAEWTLGAMLLPHEYVHSWNGKYRRPAGLLSPNYDAPMKDNLLWVYEGLTQYFGYVLTARSGLQTPQQWRDQLARVAMTYTHRPGRAWRPLEDTATAASTLYGAPYGFSNYRRGVDYYDEGALLWLEVDTIIRQQSHGRKSMDDFARLFYGGQNTSPEMKTYTFDDLVAALNALQPYDWREWLTDRVRKIDTQAPLGGILNAGWKLVYTDQPNSISKLAAQQGGGYDATASLGIVVTKDGVVADAIENGLAARNGIAPGMKIDAVNERRFTREGLVTALRESTSTHRPIDLLVENDDYFHTISLSYFNGPREPHLVRDASKPDLLDAIIRPRVTTPPLPLAGAE